MMETYRGTVYPYQLDHMGHMNVQWYVSKFDEGTWHLFARIGITPDYMQRETCGMAAVEQDIRYKAEVFAGDLITVKSSILELKEKSIRFRHDMIRSVTGDSVAICDIVAVHLDRHLRKARQFPEFVFEAARSLSENTMDC